MTEYKRNHTIPRALLEYWADGSTSYKGVHVHDIRSRRTYVSAGNGSKPYSFAIVNDLHIPIENGKRLVELEKWFSALEGSLLRFARQVHARRVPIVFGANGSLEKTLMALLGLECRSRYNLEMIQRELENNRGLCAALSGDDVSSAKRTNLQNLIQVVTEQVAYTFPVEFSILHAPKGRSWIISDRPFVASNEGPTRSRSVVLTNKVLVTYRRADEDQSECGHFDADEKTVDAINADVALTARDWIVADTPETLAKYASLVNTDRWKSRVAEDRLSLLPIRFSTKGWAITR